MRAQRHARRRAVVLWVWAWVGLQPVGRENTNRGGITPERAASKSGDCRLSILCAAALGTPHTVNGLGMPPFALRPFVFQGAKKRPWRGDDQRPLGRACTHKSAMSANPPTAAHKRALHEVRVGAITELMRCSKQPLYSITSSARASSEGGTAIPSALAVLRLITSSNLVGCSTGRSDGFVPLRILPT
jgi:hypothetical protein